MTFIVYIDNMYVTDDAATKEEAIEEARLRFIEWLQREKIEWIVEEE